MTAVKIDLDLWQTRVTEGGRLYFRIEPDSYVLGSIRSHSKWSLTAKLRDESRVESFVALR